jgi:hypothetical protein
MHAKAASAPPHQPAQLLFNATHLRDGDECDAQRRRVLVQRLLNVQ